MDTPELSSAGLSLSTLRVSDARDLFEVFRDAETVRYWPERPHEDIEETERSIGRTVAGDAHWWTIRESADGPAMGMVGFLDNAGAPGMGYILHRAFWRRGITSEAVRTALSWGFASAKFERVELWIHSENVASRTLAARLGFVGRGRFRQSVDHRGGSEETFVCGLTADEWHGRSESVVPRIRTYWAEPILQVRDAGVSAAFFRDVLGFEIGFEIGQPVRFAMVHRGEWFPEGARFRLSTAAEPRASETLIQVGPEIDALHDSVIAAGGLIVNPLATLPWGFREFSVADLDANVITFGTPV
jgi:RimJ/RimL family protein N-acetyltransferase/predicted enzyme related to lactoylglutathione lyase